VRADAVLRARAVVEERGEVAGRSCHALLPETRCPSPRESASEYAAMALLNCRSWYARLARTLAFQKRTLGSASTLHTAGARRFTGSSPVRKCVPFRAAEPAASAFVALAGGA